MVRCALMTFVVLTAFGNTQAQSPFREIAESDNVHLLVDDECTLNGKYVKRVSLTSNNGLTILYKNTTDKRVTPKVRILLLDKYGLPVKEAEDRWLSNLAPEDTRSNTTRLEEIDAKKLLGFTSVRLPEDAGVIKYIYIAE